MSELISLSEHREQRYEKAAELRFYQDRLLELVAQSNLVSREIALTEKILTMIEAEGVMVVGEK